MLKKFKVKNYRNFKEEVVVDFGSTAGYQFSTDCITKETIGKMLIYGRNATGKTNLGRAIDDIRKTLVASVFHFGSDAFLNGDATEDAASFFYQFEFEGKALVYEYARFSEEVLKWERLSVDGELIFEFDFAERRVHCDNLKVINAETANVDIYILSMDFGIKDNLKEPPIPFLRWLISNVVFEKDHIVVKLRNYVAQMQMISGNRNLLSRERTKGFYEILGNADGLKDFEFFLNHMGIQCKLKLETLPDGEKKLYFQRERLIPFLGTASSGTLALMDIYQRLFSWGTTPSFLYLDEFDAFYHYEMSEKMIQFLKRGYPNCQVIITSHNTNLMTNRLFRPDCLFILSTTGTLTALSSATPRELREGHNLEKMYVSGEFEAYE